MNPVVLRQVTHMAVFTVLGLLSILMPLPVYALFLATLMCGFALIIAVPNDIGTWLLRTFDIHRRTILPAKGVFLGLFGLLLSSLAFPEHRLAAHLVLALADASSTLVGTFTQSSPLVWSHKTVSGFLSFVVVGGAVLTIFSPLGVFAAFIIAVIESIDYRSFVMLDDNFLIPIATGALLTIL